MNWEELKKEFKYEFQTLNKNYDILDLHSDKEIKRGVFSATVRFSLHHCNTYVFLSREIIDKQADYTIRKLVTIDNDGVPYIFESLDSFIKWISNLEVVTYIGKYGQGL